MKKAILIFSTFFVISCQSQKSLENNIKCKVSETENLMAFDSLYTNMDTTKVFKNKLKEFERIKSGVLFCQFLPNMKYGKFTEVKNVNNKLVCYNSSLSTEKETVLKDSDIELLMSNMGSVNKKYYYEECDEYISHDSFYLMFIKRDGEIVAKYFSHGSLSFKKTEGNVNLNILKSILEVMYRNSFR